MRTQLIDILCSSEDMYNVMTYYVPYKTCPLMYVELLFMTFSVDVTLIEVD